MEGTLLDMARASLRSAYRSIVTPYFEHKSFRFFLVCETSFVGGPPTVDTHDEERQKNTFTVTLPLADEGCYFELFTSNNYTDGKKQGYIFHLRKGLILAHWGGYAIAEGYKACANGSPDRGSCARSPDAPVPEGAAPAAGTPARPP